LQAHIIQYIIQSHILSKSHKNTILIFY